MTSATDDFDIYGDLLGNEEREGKENDHQTFETSLSDFALLEDWQKRMTQEKNQLENELNENKAKLAKLEKVNNILKANISSLFKTAKAELKRKNDQINELTNKLDDIIFRRHRNASLPVKQTLLEDKYDKSKYEKQASSKSVDQSRSSVHSKETNSQSPSYSSENVSKDRSYTSSSNYFKRSFDHSQSSHHSGFGQNSKKFKAHQHH